MGDPSDRSSDGANERRAAAPRADWLAQAGWALGGIVLAVVAFEMLGLGRGDDGARAFLEAAQRGRASELRARIEAGVDPDVASGEGWTALHYASFLGRRNAVETLLRAGARVDARSWNGQTPLFRAALRGDRAIARMLVARGADVGARSLTGETVLTAAIAGGHAEVARLLVQHGADPDVRDPRSRQTPLAFAVSNRHTDLVRDLLEAGANANERGASGAPPLVLAARAGSRDVVALLLDAGADPDLRTTPAGGSNSALHEAARRGDDGIAIAELLLARGADRAVRNAAGKSAADVAAEAGSRALARLLEGRP